MAYKDVAYAVNPQLGTITTSASAAFSCNFKGFLAYGRRRQDFLGFCTCLDEAEAKPRRQKAQSQIEILQGVYKLIPSFLKRLIEAI